MHKKILQDRLPDRTQKYLTKFKKTDYTKYFLQPQWNEMVSIMKGKQKYKNLWKLNTIYCTTIGSNKKSKSN